MSRTFTMHRPKPAPGRPVPKPVAANPSRTAAPKPATTKPATPPTEIGGPEGPEPTRYGDWERKGVCVDF
jgi:hypothetical protein